MSPIEDAESKESLLNFDKGEVINAEALHVKFKIMKQAVGLSLQVNLECTEKRLASL